MENDVIEYLSKYMSLSDELVEIIEESSIIKKYKKGTVLLKQGEHSKEAYFILKGCIRSYIIKEGEDKTIEFYTEEQPLQPSSYGKKAPSEHYLECIEDIVALVSNSETESTMLTKYPQLKSICIVMAEVMASKYQESLSNYIISNPEERYLKLLKERPYLFQRVPQYQIASYLGITPESLSRIRKQLAKNT